MTLATLRQCRQVGCKKLTRQTYCEEHEIAHRKDFFNNKKNKTPQRKTPPSNIYATPRWKALRKVFLAANPICCRCNRNLAEHVDHITPLSDGGKPFDTSNLQSLCRSCHSSKTLGEQNSRRNKRE